MQDLPTEPFHEQPHLLEGVVENSAKYVGGMHRYENGSHQEKAARLQAIAKAWNNWKLWASRTPFRFRAIAFNGQV
eukprot:5468578-Pyramimonas_sp.AAC.1